MKTFFQFISESNAVQQATRMGLKSDGHGGWYDKKGEFVAKTEKGSLKFFNKRQKEDNLNFSIRDRRYNNKIHLNQIKKRNYQEQHLPQQRKNQL